ncbi:MAG: S8 family serine peptidase [Candidatus Thorarchaeota archaeon]|nr:S8 family serine peptidase [Candidatus Thorarchaeota archaeon]
MVFLVVSSLVIANPMSPQQTTSNAPIPADASPTVQVVDKGEKIMFSARFARDLTALEVESYRALGLDFGEAPRSIGSVYIVEASEVALSGLRNDALFESAQPLTNQHYQIPRDVSAQETYARVAWNLRDYSGSNITGKNIMIADLDTGVQWRHPDLLFADGGVYYWLDVNTNTVFDNGTDGIDGNGNGIISPNETLYSIDTDKNSAFDLQYDWLWMDNGTVSGAIDDLDSFFIVNDTNSNSAFNPSDTLVGLKTPKTKYIVEKSGGNIQVWDRDANFTSCTSYDVDGHGTGVAGILNGGHLGYSRRFVGVAPDAELMAIDIFGSNGLTVEEGLIWARDHGADVILVEVGSWTFEFLDGSSNAEVMIDTLRSQGIPVVVPAGNLGGAKRHTNSAITGNLTLSTQFKLPSGLGANNVYITILSDKPVDKGSLIVVEPTSSGALAHLVNLGVGYGNWATTQTANFTAYAFIANSTRAGNHMIAVQLFGTIMDTLTWSVDMALPTSGNLHFYISDDASSWSGGAEWVSPTNTHLITWPSTADCAISVGSYMSRNLWAPGYGWIAPYSAVGPRVDGNPKISVAAPGGWDVLSTWSNDSAWASWMTGVGGLPLYPMFGGYQLFSGTSAAGPHVAGAAALILQVRPDCGSHVKDLVEFSAYQDGFTGPLFKYPALPSSNVWGYGKLNVSAAVEEAMRMPVVHDITRSPTSPQYSDTVTVTANVTGVDYVRFEWTPDSWATHHVSNMTLTAGLYVATIPAHQYNMQIDYVVRPVNTSVVVAMAFWQAYTVNDTTPPTILSFWHNATATVVEPTWVTVAAAATEPVNASGVWAADIEYTVNNWAATNIITMQYNGSHYLGTLTPLPAPLTVRFRVAVYDAVGNRNVTAEVAYVIQQPATTTTTTTTTTTATTTPTTTSTTTTTPGAATWILDWIMTNKMVLAAVGAALVLILVVARRRRS